MLSLIFWHRLFKFICNILLIFEKIIYEFIFLNHLNVLYEPELNPKDSTQSRTKIYKYPNGVEIFNSENTKSE